MCGCVCERERARERKERETERERRITGKDLRERKRKETFSREFFVLYKCTFVRVCVCCVCDSESENESERRFIFLAPALFRRPVTIVQSLELNGTFTKVGFVVTWNHLSKPLTSILFFF